MATFDATLSGSKSTSYISVERADEIFTDTLNFATWDGFTEDQKKQGLNAATMWLETLPYGGSRCGIPSADDATKPQALLWPRSGVTCEGYTASCELIPYKIERAEALIALQLIQNPGAIIPEGGSGGGAETEQEEVSEEEEVVEEESSSTEDPVNIKLRFLDDSELDVTTKLSECLKKFRRRHLDTHLSLSPADKVILASFSVFLY